MSVIFTKYYSEFQTEKNKMDKSCVTREKKDAYRVLVGKTEEKRPVGNPRARWDYNIKCIFEKWDMEIYCIDMDRNRKRWPGSFQCFRESSPFLKMWEIS
jgi:hypothetical protein